MTEYISKVQDEDTGKIAYFKDSKAREDIETLNSQFKDIANKTIVEGNKIYLVKPDGTKLDEGTDLPTSSGSSEADDITIKAHPSSCTFAIASLSFTLGF